MQYYDSQGNEITCNSQPNYDGWGWDDFWSCADWIKYHKVLKTCYSNEEANQMWVDALAQGDLFGHESNCQGWDYEFISYANSQGIDAQLLPGLLHSGETIVSSGADLIAFLSKLIKPAAILGLIGVTVYVVDKFGIPQAVKRTFKR